MLLFRFILANIELLTADKNITIISKSCSNQVHADVGNSDAITSVEIVVTAWGSVWPLIILTVVKTRLLSSAKKYQ